jgi:hypothetical protein
MSFLDVVVDAVVDVIVDVIFICLRKLPTIILSGQESHGDICRLEAGGFFCPPDLNHGWCQQMSSIPFCVMDAGSWSLVPCRAAASFPKWHASQQHSSTLGYEPDTRLIVPFLWPTRFYDTGLVQLNNTMIKCEESNVKSNPLRSEAGVHRLTCILLDRAISLEIFGLYLTLESADIVLGAFTAPGQAFHARHAKLAGRQYNLTVDIPYPGTYSIAIDLVTSKGHVPISRYRGDIWTITSTITERIASPLVLQECKNVLPWRGNWIKCTSPLKQGSGCGAWGYAFQPSSNCHYGIWNHDDLRDQARVRENHWIVVFGTSVQRGLFLRAADLLLGKTENEIGVLSKCWGRMDVEVGNIRLTYVDFRGAVHATLPLKSETSRSFECHGSNIARDEYTLQRNSTLFSQQLFTGRKQPTCIVLSQSVVGSSTSESMGQIWKEYLSLPTNWDGHVILPYFRSPLWNNFDVDNVDPHQDILQAEEKVSAGFGRKVNFVDVGEIALPFLRYRENNVRGMSQHWHHAIGLASKASHRDFISPKDVMVDGIVVDAVVQMFFNIEFGPKSLLSSSVDDSPLRVRVCLDCPNSLLPFQTKPKYDLQCFDKVPSAADLKKSYTAPTVACPKSCLVQPPVGMIQTQSGKIESRICAG